MSGEALVELTAVRLGYGRRVVLEGVDVAIQDGDFVGIVGPNGSGKSTLLNAILGQLRPQAGELRYGGPLADRHEVPVRFGYVPQFREADELFPLSALEVALMGVYPRLGLFRRPGKRDREWALECLDQVSASGLARQAFRELSGGQKQRVLVARALATGAPVLLLDEPTNDMDIRSEHDLMELFARFHEAGHKTLVFVSHLLHLVLSYAPRIGILHGGTLTVLGAAELGNGEHLSALYGLPVEVVDHGGYRTLVPRSAHDGA
jgi:ABC-type cobalamin/Fe3+-siderophores transport system ATPase subunit